MWAHGLKRKLDQDGEEEDGSATPLPPPPPHLPPPPLPPYNLQRQLVLNMSLLKLYGSGGRGGNLDLQRRVLINNIIRRIHDDFRQEGERVVGPAQFFSAASAAPPSVDDAFSCLTPASLLEDDLPVFFTLPLPPSSPSPSPPTHSALLPQMSPRLPPISPSANDSFSSALEEIEELCPSPPLPTPAARQVVEVVMKEERRSQQATPLALAPPPPTATPFLTDFALEDVLFTDIDTSMYDLCTPGLLPTPFPSPPSGALPSKLTTEGLVRSVSGFGQVGAGPQNQPMRMDLTELDHIMEVLVGS